jgi:glycosyltransferase involved in cell wall biosynthesis
LTIAIIHPYFDVTGGAERTSLSLINSLITKKIHTTLYCVKPPKIEASPYLSIYSIKQKRIPMFWRLQKMMEVKELFSLISDEDILFVTSGGLTMQKSNAKKIYVYCHSSFLSEIKFLKNELYGVKKIYLKIIQNYFKKSLECLKNKNVELIANSNYTATGIKENLGKKSLVIFPPVIINEFYKQNVKKEEKIVTVSRFSIEKNLDDAVEIFNRVNYPCELIGNAKHKNQLKILEQLKSKKRTNIKIYSNISKTKIKQLLKSAKVYLHTSEETFGISVVESISAGCIPIVPDNSAHKETVPFEVLRYKDNEDAIKKINDAMDGKFDGLLSSLSSHIKKFSNEIFQKKILELIEK